MRLATFEGRAAWNVGIVEGNEIIDLTAADPSLASMTPPGRRHRRPG